MKGAEPNVTRDWAFLRECWSGLIVYVFRVEIIDIEGGIGS